MVNLFTFQYGWIYKIYTIYCDMIIDSNLHSNMGEFIRYKGTLIW